MNSQGQLAQVNAGAVTVEANDVKIVNSAGAAILGLDEAISVPFAVSDGSLLGQGLIVDNSGLIKATEGSAIHSNSSFEVINRAGGVIEAHEIAVFSQNGNATVFNAGTISGETEYAIKANILTLENSGTIEGGIGAQYYLSNIVNHGVITGGYYAYGGLTLTNYGSSTGDLEIDVTAVAGQGYSGYTVAIVDNRSTFAGNILITGEALSYLQPPPPGTVYRSEITNSGTIDGSIVSDPTLGASPNGAAMDFSFAEMVINNGNITGDVVLGAGDDRYSGTGSVAGSIDGGSGDDELLGGGQSDRLQGGEGNDEIDGRAGNDLISGGTGTDFLRGGAGDDVLDGGDGGDRALYDDALAGVTVNLVSGVATSTVGTSAGIGTDQLIDVEWVTGGSFDDLITGNSGFNILRGGAGNDVLDGADNDDALVGGEGNDQLLGGAGDDQLEGEHGDDLLDGGAGADQMYGWTGNDTYVVDDGFDVVIEEPGAGTDIVRSSIGVDFAAGSFFVGEIENITLTGNAAVWARGNDLANSITGNSAANELLGRGGNDRLTGSLGNDTLAGGAGNDSFHDTAAGLNGDTITDFAVGDRIVISDANLDGFSYSLSGNTLTFAGGSLTLSGVANGNLIARAAAEGGVELILSQFTDHGDVLVSNFGVGAGGWSSQDRYPRHVADMNGDGFNDIVGFGHAGVLVSYGSAGGTFSAPGLVVDNFGHTQGWTSDNQFHRELADLNGDGRADIIGFGVAGTWVSLAQANGSFSAPTIAVANFGLNQGWVSQESFARTVGDANGDGKADIVGFGVAGAWLSLGKGDGTFEDPTLAVENFGAQQGWTSDNQFHRAVADINGDGFDDIVGFGSAGTWAALSNGDGTFGEAYFALENFGNLQGWTSQDAFARQVADVNGDGIVDIVGFGLAGIWVGYGQADGSFLSVSRDVDAFGPNQGWASDATYHRQLADINNDGLNDIVGFGHAGVYAGINQSDWWGI